MQYVYHVSDFITEVLWFQSKAAVWRELMYVLHMLYNAL